ncbi:MAG: NUDIX domain-containing protein [bacterium]
MPPQKRLTAHLIPYKINNGIFSFFLQKRSDNTERNPGKLSIFGGGVEGVETPEQGMLREMKEELNFTPENYFYLGEYTSDYSISHYYAVEVNDDFESIVTVGEGDYGVFLSEDDISHEDKISDDNKIILADLRRRILMV